MEGKSTMRASEALLLGSTQLHPLAGIRRSGNGNAGCALGMIEVAISTSDLAEHVFLWLEDTQVSAYPCQCNYVPSSAYSAVYGWNIAVGVAHIFNEHVMGDQTWTIKRLAEWIESCDPTPKVVEVAEEVECEPVKQSC